MPAPAGQLTLHESAQVPLAAAADGTLAGRFVADKDGFYRVGLQGPDGTMITASPQYVIDVLADMAPTVAIAKPGRDTAATPVEEFVVEARADDDFGVRGLELVYSVNGGPEKTVPLYRGAKRLEEVTAGHTFYLEELGVQAGDAVAYYARASDNDAGGGKQATSDMYFLRVRPFGKEFKPATSQAGGGGGGGGGGARSGRAVGTAAPDHRRHLQRAAREEDASRPTSCARAPSCWRCRRAGCASRSKGSSSRMNSRLVAPDPAFKKIADLLPLAAAEMKAAEAKLQARSPEGAMPSEQKALQYLQQAEEEYEMQVQTSRESGGGGGGGQAGSIAEDLADLFELEMDKMANQYETASRAESSQAEQQVDALAEKLKELARRQQQELERQRRRAAGQAAGSGGDQQRALAEQAEEAARQLEKLSREQNRPDLAAAARQMQQAADAMRKAAAGNDPGAAGQAAAASDRLQQVQRQLRGRADGARRTRRAGSDAPGRRDRARARRRGRRRREARRAPAPTACRRRSSTRSAATGCRPRSAQLEQQLDKTANEIAKDERDASRRLQEAAGEIRDDKIKEKLRYSRGLLGRDGQPGADRRHGRRDRLEPDGPAPQAGRGRVGARQGRRHRRQDRRHARAARDLVRGVDSLGRRMQERAAGRPRPAAGGNSRPASTDSGGQQASKAAGPAGPARPARPAGPAGPARPSRVRRASRGSRASRDRQAAGQAGQRPGRTGPGQQGQQGQDGQGGMGGGDNAGGWNDDGGWGNGRPGNFNADDVRQFRGEARRYGQDLEALRRALRADGVDTRDLDDILKRLKALDDDRVYRDVQELARLQGAVSEGLRRFEFGLRRAVDGEASATCCSRAATRCRPSSRAWSRSTTAASPSRRRRRR